jgi:hypothetical protein
MKLKSLILGSVAAAGLSTAGFAADLGVLTSLDVCDELGLSGLTISSDTNCLQISGGVSYEFRWGDYRNETGGLQLITDVPFDVSDIIEAGGTAPDVDLDWQSKVEAFLTVIGTQPSDFGPAKAVITLKYNDHPRYRNEVFFDNDGEGEFVYADEAYVAIGDTTIIMAGKKKDGVDGSVANLGDDQPFNFLGSFISSGVDGGGVLIDGDTNLLGGDSIQVVSDLGNGVNVGVGLENLDGDETIDPYVGSLVGVVEYAGENITAHVTGAAFGILDGEVDSYAIHAGATGTFDMFKIRGAVGYRHADLTEAGIVVDRDLFHALLTGEATFDIFKVALTGEYAYEEDDLVGLSDEGFAIGGSIGADITEGVSINLGARYFSGDNDLTGIGLEEEALHVAAQLVASITETIKITGEIGGYFNDDRGAIDPDSELDDGLYYGAAELAWAPGGGFTSSVKGEVYSNEAYRVTFKAAKNFE